MDNRNFSDVKVGDKIVIRQSFRGRWVAEVTKVLKNWFIVRGPGCDIKFRKDGGSEVGGDTWHFWLAIKATDEEIKKVSDENKKAKFVQFLRGFKYENLDLETLETIAGLVKGDKEENTTNNG